MHSRWSHTWTPSSQTSSSSPPIPHCSQTRSGSWSNCPSASFPGFRSVQACNTDLGRAQVYALEVEPHLDAVQPDFEQHPAYSALFTDPFRFLVKLSFRI